MSLKKKSLTNSVTKKCSVEGCDGKHYANGHCRNCGERLRRNGTVKRKYHLPYTEKDICKYKGCKDKVQTNGHCSKHRQRVLRHGDPAVVAHAKGVAHKWWKGGIAYYKNHYSLKKNRLEKLKETGGICEMCGGANGTNAHHKDGSRENHAKENLKMICSKCVIFLKNSKFNTFKLFGSNSVKDLASRCGVSVYYMKSYLNKSFYIKPLVLEKIKNYLSDKNIS